MLTVKSTSPIFLLVSLIVIVREHGATNGAYLNQWAVRVRRGIDPHSIATQHGFVIKEKILDEYYLFVHPHVHRRSAEPSLHHHSLLENHQHVEFVEQQVAKRRVKRDTEPHGSTASAIKLNDASWNAMWYMHGGATGGYDMNVIPAWKRGYTGKGVVVTILDDGIEYSHPDLKDNYDPEASTDVNGEDSDPFPRYDPVNTNRHGTRCAGEVAAKANNSNCIVGVAYNAKIGGVRMLDGDVSDWVEAQSLSLNPQHIDIYSASWGPDDNGKVVDGPAKLAREAFINGILKGRNGKGSIFVWASGNGGRQSDSCNCDGYTNSIFTLSVSSASEKGTKPWYLEECSSTIATTYSSGDAIRERKVVTTDLHNGCTEQHTGTSASAPMAAGVCALVLEANPELTWRDLQHITVMTARHEPLVEPEWVINGVGRRVSHRYGYGLMDAAKMVELAENWVTVPEQKICSEEVQTLNRDIGESSLLVSIDSNGCQTGSNVKYLEHVQAKIKLRYSRRGDLRIRLTSPAGTTSTILHPRPHDNGQGSFTDWPFMSTFFWGERSEGTWKLEIENVGKMAGSGTLYSWQLVLYGTSEEPYKYGGDSESTTKPACHEECDEDAGCDGPNPEDCALCKVIRLGSDGPCVPACPKNSYADLSTGLCEQECHTGTFADSTTLRCTACPLECATCNSATQCTSCTEGFTLNARRKHCIAQCAPKQFINGAEMCQNCHESCATCSSSSANDCTSCAEGFTLQNGVCLAECDIGYFMLQEADGSKCRNCDISCYTCSGEGSDQCESCRQGWRLEGSRCLSPCTENEFVHVDGSCLHCDATCAACSGGQASDCVSCPPMRYLMNGQCLPTCDAGYYEQDSVAPAGGSCQKCHASCYHCEGPAEDQCTGCVEGHSLQNGFCLECEAGTYRSNSQCYPCDSSCLTCSDVGPDSCTSCHLMISMLLLNGRCVTTCPDVYYESSGVCQRCHPSCAACHGAEVNACTKCKQGRLPENGVCPSSVADSENCDSKQYYDIFSKRCTNCDKSCLTCQGGGSSSCLSCRSPLNLDQGRCLPCCSASRTEQCCNCHPQTGVCMENRNSDYVSPPSGNNLLLRKDERHSTYSDSFPGESINDYKHLTAVVAVSCAACIALFFVAFGLLQAKSNGALCWRYDKYQKVPTNASVSFTVGRNGHKDGIKMLSDQDFANEDDEEEIP